MPAFPPPRHGSLARSPRPPRSGSGSDGNEGTSACGVSVVTVIGSGVRYCGAVSADDPTPSDVNATSVVIAAIESVIDVDAVTYLAPELYQSVVVEVSAQGIRVTDRLTDRIIVDCNITEVAATATRQSQNGENAKKSPPYFGFITQQLFGAMAVGFVCHVFQCDSDATAATTVGAIGRAFFSMTAANGASSSPRMFSSRRSNSARRKVKRSNSTGVVSTAPTKSMSLPPDNGFSNSPSPSDRAGRSLLMPPDNGLASGTSSGRPRAWTAVSSSSSRDDVVDQKDDVRMDESRSDLHVHSDSPDTEIDEPTTPRRSSRSRRGGAGSDKSGSGCATPRADDTDAQSDVSGSAFQRSTPVDPNYFVQQTAQNLLRRLAAEPDFKLSPDRGLTFTGHAVVTFLVKTGDFTQRQYAVGFMDALIQARAIHPVASSASAGQRHFEDSEQQYRFSESVTRQYVSELESGKGSSAEADTTEFEVSESADQFDLMKAIAQDAPAAVKTILDQWGDLSPSAQKSCMMRSVKRKAVNVVASLISRGFPVDCRDRNGDTLLHRAAYYGDTPMVKLLLGASADPHDRANSDHATPLFRASRLRNLGCAILLMEHGARLHTPNIDGVRPIDLLPELEETQQRLCASVAKGFTAAGSTDELAVLRRLVSNDENDDKLIRQLADASTLPATLEACKANPAIAEQWMAVLDKLFERGARRRRSADLGLLRAVVPAAVMPGSLGERAVALCLCVIQDDLAGQGDGCLASLAKVVLTPLVRVIVEPGHPPGAYLMSARIVAGATRFKEGRKQLSVAGTIEAMCRVCSECADRRYESVLHGDALTHALEIVANLLLVPGAQLAKESGSLALRTRLHALANADASPDVRFQATRVCVFAGFADVPGHCLLDVTELRRRGLIADAREGDQRAVDGPPQDPLHWGGVRGLSVEGFSAMLLDVSSPLTYLQIHLLHGSHFPPVIVFRMLTSQLRALGPPIIRDEGDGDGGGGSDGTMPGSHRRVFHVLKLWVEHRLADFMASPVLLDDMKFLMQTLQARHDVYAKLASDLLDTAVSTSSERRVPSGVADYSLAAHHRLYERAARLVRSGNLPCPKQLAVTLAAAALYVEDLEERRAARDAELNSLKRVLPPWLLRDKEMPGLVAAEYGRICGLTLRDAKHLYLDTCKLVDFDYFPVKQPVESGGSGQGLKKVSRLLGIGHTSIVLLHEKTKAVVHRVPTANVRSWELAVLKDKGKDWAEKAAVSERRASLKGTFLGSRGTTYLVINVGKGGEMMRLTGELSTLGKAAEALLTSTNRLSRERRNSVSDQMSPPVLRRSGTSRGSRPTSTSFEDGNREDGASGGSGESASAFSTRSRSEGIRPGSADERSEREALVSASSSSPPPRSMSVAHAQRPGASDTHEEHGRSRGGRNVPPADDKFACSCPPTPEVVGDLALISSSLKSLLEFPKELARQLTLVEDTFFRAITVRSLIDHVMSSSSGGHNEACDSFIAHFNHTTRALATVVLDQPARESRRRCIEQIVQLGVECLALNNLNGVMECIAALNSTALRRLHGTWDDVSPKALAELEKLETLLDFSNNFRAYREAIGAMAAPAIPYFGVVLKDITSAHQGAPNTLPSGLVNVSKWRPILGVLNSVERLQTAPYNLISLPQFRAKIHDALALDEDELDVKSRNFHDPAKAHRDRRHSLFGNTNTSSVGSPPPPDATR